MAEKIVDGILSKLSIKEVYELTKAYRLGDQINTHFLKRLDQADTKKPIARKTVRIAAEPKKVTKKNRLSAAGRKAIAEASRRRWSKTRNAKGKMRTKKS